MGITDDLADVPEVILNLSEKVCVYKSQRRRGERSVGLSCWMLLLLALAKIEETATADTQAFVMGVSHQTLHNIDVTDGSRDNSGSYSTNLLLLLSSANVDQPLFSG